ncbi:MAG: hypothetical protein HY718_08750 [Planctomycetes bacterium]|nr:hypothetical protein [Planctomycetota bacterium]
MSWPKLRTIAFVVLCGGTLLQTNTSCTDVLAPIISSIAASVVSGFINNLLLMT